MGVASGTPRRHNLTADSLSLWLAQSLHPFFWNVPELQIRELVCGCTTWDWAPQLCIPMLQFSWSLSTAKSNFLDEGQRLHLRANEYGSAKLPEYALHKHRYYKDKY